MGCDGDAAERGPDLHAKMRDWVDNGAILGVLIDAGARVVWRTHAGGAVDRPDAPSRVSCEALLPGLELDLAGVW